MTFWHAPWVSAATLLVVVMIVDGALLQRASSVKATTLAEDVRLSILLTPELAHGFSGQEVANGMATSDEATRVFNDFMDEAPMMTNFTGCHQGSKCTGTIRAPGVTASHCNHTTWPITPEMLHSANASWGTVHKVQNNNGSLEHMGISKSIQNPIFTIETFVMVTTDDESLPEGMGVTTGIAGWTHLNGHFVLRDCALTPSILEYDVTFDSGRIVPPSDMSEARLVAFANNTERFSLARTGPTETHPATMDAFSIFMSTIVEAEGLASFSLPSPPGQTWQTNSDSMNSYMDQFVNWDAGANNLAFDDPLPDIMSKMNNMMMRAGLISARKYTNLASRMDPGLSANQTIAGKQHTRANVFHTDLRWFAGAAVLELLAIVVVLPLFYGFWRFPNDLSQSPFEMALAFNSPLVSDVNSREGVKGVLARHGDVRVSYGLVKGGDRDVERLGFAESGHVVRPW
ncbi:uncharacterized protein LTR77_005220 [Saxophila tyrrhenica]|uniref:Uncharacterized protein n=1 Tax=Saxophila tyrrhenica TaxID=1690608 RepID=A0AAV9PBC9_9PEZI|nr:hypothetical protein LTR77_005220 [Saxophila tyrrhenica]